MAEKTVGRDSWQAKATSGRVTGSCWSMDLNETHHPVKLVGTGVTHRVLTLGGGFGVAAFLAARVVAGRLS